MDNRQPKRLKRNLSTSMKTTRQEEAETKWPRFVCLNGEDDRLRRLSAIKLCLELQEFIGATENVSRPRSGPVLIHLKNLQEWETLRASESWRECQLRSRPIEALTAAGV